MLRQVRALPAQAPSRPRLGADFRAELFAEFHAEVPTPTLSDEALSECVRARVRALRSLLRATEAIEVSMKARLAEHPAAQLLATMPRIGEVNLAQIVAEVLPVLARHQRRAGRRRDRRVSGHQGLGSRAQRPLSLGRQRAGPPGAVDLRRQQSPRVALGRAALS